MFACSPYDADSQCISDASKVCDNVFDCDNGADEENCAALAPTDLPMDPDSPKSLHVSGLLHWKVNGRFHPLSLHLEGQVNVDQFGFSSVYSPTKCPILPQDAQSIFESMAEEACLEIDSELDIPKVRLVKADEEGIDNFKSFAHAELDLGGSGGAKFSGGPMKVELDGMTTYFLQVCT